MTPHEILKAARELITPPEKWTQGALARDAYGKSVGVQSDDADCFCAAGAIAKVCGDVRDAYDKAWDELCTQMPGFATVSGYNDSHSHSQIIDRFDRAIAATAPASEQA